MGPKVKIAILDNSLNPAIYDPVCHWGRYLSVPWQAFRPKEGALPDLEQGFSHLLLTGSEASILEREDWVKEEVRLVREAAGRRLAILGSCYGHQLLALALAGPRHIRRRAQPEVGWLPIRILRPSRLLGAKDRPYTFSVHFDEVVGLQDPFEVLAFTESTPIQAFCLKGKPVWGLQPHPEINPVEAKRLLADFSRLSPSGSALYQLALASQPRDSGLVRRVVRAFVEARPEESFGGG